MAHPVPQPASEIEGHGVWRMFLVLFPLGVRLAANSRFRPSKRIIGNIVSWTEYYYNRGNWQKQGLLISLFVR